MSECTCLKHAIVFLYTPITSYWVPWNVHKGLPSYNNITCTCTNTWVRDWVVYSSFIPLILMVLLAPCRRWTTGGTAAVGEELIFPLSSLGEKSPVKRTSQLPPFWASETQPHPVYLHGWMRQKRVTWPHTHTHTHTHAHTHTHTHCYL